MRALRTPDDRFRGLPEHDFEPRYVQVPAGDGGSLRVHHLDEGPRDAPPVLLLHGEPSWSFLYRRMVPVLTRAGLRVVAPDLVGFGRSDKPAARSDYTYMRHVAWMRALVEALDLRRVTLFGQDWGGLIGFRLVAEDPQRYARVVAANTGLPTGDQDLGPAFQTWRRLSQEVPDLAPGSIVQGGTVSDLPDEVVAAYDAPFPDETFKAGVRQFPMLVPASPDDPASEDNRRAWRVLESWAKPWLCLYSDSDPITRGGDAPFRQRIPGAAGQPHRTIEGAGHFLQEDRGAELAEIVASWIRAT